MRIHAVSFIAVCLFIAPKLATPTAEAAEEDIGEALGIVDSATASGAVGNRPLTPGAAVYLGDVIATDGQGEAQLLFSDGTRMVVGPNSQMVLDEFVFRGAASENKFAVRALGGAFRFITGEGPSEAYEIRTPSGTMGVRGTKFDFAVTPDETSVLLYDGSTILCGGAENCVTGTVERSQE